MVVVHLLCAGVGTTLSALPLVGDVESVLATQRSGREGGEDGVVDG